jgi:biotin carboxylase
VAASPILRQYVDCLVQRLGYTGVGLAQFIVDEASGSVCFLEVNPRLGVNTVFPLRCGLDLPRLAVSVACGLPLPSPADPFSYPIGVRYVWTFGDLVALAEARRGGEVSAPQAVRWLGRTLKACITADVHATWSLTDPRPTLSLYGTYLMGVVRRRLGRR